MTTAQRYPARTAIVGEDTPIRRALPTSGLRTIGAWCFLDHAGPVKFSEGQGLHVGAHPHIGLQTFTWLIEGEVIHRDSLGYEQVIRPGQVNLMTAGRGVAHTEDSLHASAALHAAQLWIALPEAERWREPAFQNYPELPVAEVGCFRVTVLAGHALGLTAPTQIYSPLVGLDFTCASAARTDIPLDADFEYGAMTLRGEATINGERLPPGELLYFPPGGTEMVIAADAAAQVLLLGGKPFGEPVLLWWNFVARTQEEMATALADWNASPNQGGRFGTVKSGCLAEVLKAPSLDGMNLKPAR